MRSKGEAVLMPRVWRRKDPDAKQRTWDQVRDARGSQVRGTWTQTCDLFHVGTELEGARLAWWPPIDVCEVPLPVRLQDSCCAVHTAKPGTMGTRLGSSIHHHTPAWTAAWTQHICYKHSASRLTSTHVHLPSAVEQGHPFQTYVDDDKTQCDWGLEEVPWVPPLTPVKCRQ